MTHPSVAISYSGVHNAYQQARAAAEMGGQSHFYCSLADAPGCWGRRAKTFFGEKAMTNRQIEPSDGLVITENPLPLLVKTAADRMGLSTPSDWSSANERFDLWSARKITRTNCDLFLGYETCALHSMAAAKKGGAITLLDIPQFHPEFLSGLMLTAAEKCGLKYDAVIDTPGMADRKAEEFHTADHILVYSELHAESFREAGIPSNRIHICPLWFEAGLWHPLAGMGSRKNDTLRVLFIGGITLRKGIPFLLEAVGRFKGRIKLTMAGIIDHSLDPLLKKHEDKFNYIGQQSKSALRRICADHDILALPSVADAFGFVALEAMACGLPVIISENCGAPVPDPDWVVPAMDIEALAARLDHYHKHPERLEKDGFLARQFAEKFDASNFRRRMQNLYLELLAQ